MPQPLQENKGEMGRVNCVYMVSWTAVGATVGGPRCKGWAPRGPLRFLGTRECGCEATSPALGTVRKVARRVSGRCIKAWEARLLSDQDWVPVAR